ncbi:sigma-70 family RNA polymerase sigma factor [Bacillus sp. CLL-7-23]|uniref:Sigma-70 family RNA polymerase sigma factor n=1 Tax=Bacillus changyiensis TaxID=3004103 RepID=A0ABT4X317_9BACI|nr:sigma-70 family RNA polymerase sigma factor [Bacillus changyiensis]MDA7026670.1 sigma-70 family RNA polymerase sigma factor [Bacillus changyiensis]
MKLEEVYKDIQPDIYAFFYVKTLNQEIAEDLTQEVFYQAIKSFNTFSGKATVKTWLFSIAKNILKKHYRSKRYKVNLLTLIPEINTEGLSPEEQLLKAEEQKQLLSEMNGLDELSKEIVTLRIYGELSFNEIGVLIGKTENYARVSYHRAKLKLHKQMEGYYG